MVQPKRWNEVQKTKERVHDFLAGPNEELDEVLRMNFWNKNHYLLLKRVFICGVKREVT